MLDHVQLRTHASTLAVVRDQLDAALPLAISRESIEAIERLPEAQRVSRQHVSMALVHVAHAIDALHKAAMVVDAADEGLVV